MEVSPEGEFCRGQAIAAAAAGIGALACGGSGALAITALRQSIQTYRP
jgi:hypothetical protein